MKKNVTFAKYALLCAISVGMSSTVFTSCKDYDDDINKLQTEIDKVAKDLADLKALIGDQPVKAVTYDEATGTLTVTTSAGTVNYKTHQAIPTYDIKLEGNSLIVNGEKKGDVNFDAVKAEVKDGTLWIGGKATEIKVTTPVQPGDRVELNANGELCINGKSTGIVAPIPPTVDADGYLWVNGVKTSIKNVKPGSTVTVSEDKKTITIDGTKVTLPPVVSVNEKGILCINGEEQTHLQVGLMDDAIIFHKNEAGENISVTITSKDDKGVVSSADIMLTSDTLLLKSMTFKPEAYLSGVEAMRAVNVTYNAWTVNKSDNPATATGEVWNAPAVPVIIGNISPYVTASYYLNPSTVTKAQFSKENLKFTFDDMDFVGTRSAKFNPEVIDFDVIDGVLKVTLNVKSEEIQKIDADKISVMALQATVKAGKTSQVVTSDYAGIYKSIIKDLVIAKKGATPDTHLKGADGTLVGQAIAAIEPGFEYTLAYNDTKGLDISTLIETHYKEYEDKANGRQIGGEKSMNAAMLKDYGMKYVYTLSNYYQGTNQTEQNDFANLTAEGVLTAKVFSAEGVAAVGRMPVVRVDLVDVKTNRVINAGWIKVKIVKDKVEAGSWSKPFEAFALQCSSKELDVTVEEMNVEIYNKLGLSKAEFQALYTLKTVNGLAVLNPTDNGIVQEIVNSEGNKETTILRWTLPSNEVLTDADGNFTATVIYEAKDADSRGNFVITFTTSVEKPTAKFDGKKIDEYWFNNMTTIRVNTEIPGTLGNNCDFYTDYDNVFVGNKPMYTVSGATRPVSADFAPANLSYHYEFTKENSTVSVAGYTLSASVDGKLLHATKGVSSAVIAILDQTTGVVTYQENAIAKIVLNAQVGFSAKVGIFTTNSCYAMPMIGGDFNSMFLRPVTIVGDGTKHFVDAANNGSTLNVLDMVSLKDWRETESLNSFKINKNYYNYYEVNSITVDIAKVTCNLAGGNLDTQLLSSVTDKIELVATNPNPGKPSTSGPAIGYYGTVTYTNNTNNVQAFKLKIPVTVNYKWGSVSESIIVDVKPTSSN